MLFPKKVTDNRKKNTKRKITEKVFQEKYFKSVFLVINDVLFVEHNLISIAPIMFSTETNRTYEKTETMQANL